MSLTRKNKHFKHTEETKNKIGLKNSNKPSPMKGKQLSEEHKLKISIANKGYDVGRKLSEETRQKMRNSHALKSGLKI
jgi:hypothetical protein